MAGYGSYLHGEAISIGLVLACRLSEKLGKMDSGVSGRVSNLLSQYDLPVSLRESLNVDDLLAASRKDKKSRSGRMRYIALDEIGRAVTVEGIEEGLIAELWKTAGARM